MIGIGIIVVPLVVKYAWLIKLIANKFGFYVLTFFNVLIINIVFKIL
jgi:hypothetical protein